tara:strand:+ start:52 stop:186 length:135 start_codon:yes stop_codon:yes gene_type:complete
MHEGKSFEAVASKAVPNTGTKSGIKRYDTVSLGKNTKHRGILSR